MQKALQAFRRAAEGASYADLTDQTGPTQAEDRRTIVQDHAVLNFLNSVKGPGWTRYGESFVKVARRTGSANQGFSGS